MKARVLKSIDIGFTNVKLQGKVYDVHEVVGTRVTMKICTDSSYRMIDFNLNEVELLMEGGRVEVYRNQATRDGNWIGFNKSKGYALRYAMPNGREFINLCKNPFKVDEYTTITEEKFNTYFLGVSDKRQRVAEFLVVMDYDNGFYDEELGKEYGSITPKEAIEWELKNRVKTDEDADYYLDEDGDLVM